MRKLIVLRGIAGSGKSTKAKQLMAECSGISVCCSADNYFINAAGQYVFDAKRLPAAHTYCKGKCEGAMEAQADLVIIDNTNTRRFEFEAYVKMAKKYGYETEELIVGGLSEEELDLCIKRNIHNVPKETIRKMAVRFEVWRSGLISCCVDWDGISFLSGRSWLDSLTYDNGAAVSYVAQSQSVGDGDEEAVV